MSEFGKMFETLADAIEHARITWCRTQTNCDPRYAWQISDNIFVIQRALRKAADEIKSYEG